MRTAIRRQVRGLRIGPVEPGHQRLEVGGFDRGAAPDAQARRRVAIAADVVGHAFRLQQLRPSSLARPRPRHRAVRQTEVLERVSARLGEVLREGPGCRSSAAITAGIGIGARHAGPCRPPMALRPFQRDDVVLDAEHRGRVDGLAFEDAGDQLAAGGHAEDLRQRPGRRIAFQPLHRARATG